MKTKNVNSISAVWAVILCVMMGLTACQDYSIDSQPAGAPQVQCDALEQYNVESTGVDNIVFNISANTPWKITVSTDDEDQSWCVPSPGVSSASGLVSEITVTIADNESNTPREATLTITGDNVDKKIVVKVVQGSKADLQVSGAATTEVFEVAGGTKDITIRANRAWEIVYKNEQDRNWLHFSQLSGEVNGVETVTIGVTVDANESVKREATFIVKTENDEVEKVVMQKGATLEVVEEELEKLTALSANSSATIEVPVSATINWEIEAGTDTWIKNPTKSGNKLTFTCETNYNFAPRTGTISLKAVGSSMVYSIPVTQVGATFYCWGKENQTAVDFPEGRITEKGVMLKGTDAFRLAFPGEYKRGTFTWEFAEISISTPLVLMGAGNGYNANVVPNMHLVFGGGGNVVGANDWRVNNGAGNGWWLTWQNIATLRTQNALIKTVKMVFGDGVKLYLYDKDGVLLNSKEHATTTEDAKWVGADGFGYSLYFHGASGKESDYCILKSFKAEPAE